ncbi:MAG: FKBP-type peptidyl-prolyl cis-trans isomerase [Polyangia bacterium]
MVGRITSFSLALSLVFATGCTKAGGGTAEPKTEEQKTLYAIGLVIARQTNPFALKPEEIAYVSQAMADVAANKTPAVDLAVYGPKINELVKARAGALKERETARANEEKKAGAAFLDTAAKEAGATKLPSGLVYREISPGTGEMPKSTDRVKVNYTGKLRDGKVFDTSVGKQPVVFGLNGVIPCWTEGVQKMKVGGKAQLTCPSDLAYKDGGRPGIPGGATLSFEVELLSIEPPAPAPTMTMPGMGGMGGMGGMHPGMGPGGAPHAMPPLGNQMHPSTLPAKPATTTK